MFRSDASVRCREAPSVRARRPEIVESGVTKHFFCILCFVTASCMVNHESSSTCALASPPGSAAATRCVEMLAQPNWILRRRAFQEIERRGIRDRQLTRALVDTIERTDPESLDWAAAIRALDTIGDETIYRELEMCFDRSLQQGRPIPEAVVVALLRRRSADRRLIESPRRVSTLPCTMPDGELDLMLVRAHREGRCEDRLVERLERSLRERDPAVRQMLERLAISRPQPILPKALSDQIMQLARNDGEIAVWAAALAAGGRRDPDGAKADWDELRRICESHWEESGEDGLSLLMAFAVASGSRREADLQLALEIAALDTGDRQFSPAGHTTMAASLRVADYWVDAWMQEKLDKALWSDSDAQRAGALNMLRLVGRRSPESRAKIREIAAADANRDVRQLAALSLVTVGDSADAQFLLMNMKEWTYFSDVEQAAVAFIARWPTEKE